MNGIPGHESATTSEEPQSISNIIETIFNHVNCCETSLCNLNVSVGSGDPDVGPPTPKQGLLRFHETISLKDRVISLRHRLASIAKGLSVLQATIGE